MFKDRYIEIYDKVTPDKQLLANTLELKRVSKGYKKRQATRFIAIPAGAAASLLIAFTLLVNLSPAFALAVEPIPVLRELAAVVSFSPSLRDAVDYSPSLSAAVDNDYIQIIGQEQTVNGITMRIEYVIVDKQQLHVFYTLQSEQYTDMWLRERTLTGTDGIPLDGYTTYITRSLKGYWDGDIEQEDLRQLIFTFSGAEVPGSVFFNCGIADLYGSEYVPVTGQANAFSSSASPIPVSTFSFPLSFDSELIPPTEAIAIEREFSFDGQDFIITNIDISPTTARINIIENEANTAWLKSMTCFLIDENGVRFNQTGYCFDNLGYGIESKTTYYLESPFFAESQSLTLVITDALWLDKDAGYTKVDLVNHTATNLPPDVKFIYAGRNGDDYALTFSALNREPAFYDPFFEDMGRQIYTLFENEFFDEDNNAYRFSGGGGLAEHYEIWDSPDAWAVHLSPEEYEQLVINEELMYQLIPGYRQGLPNYYRLVETPGWFCQIYMIAGYPHDVLYLKPSFSRMTTLDAPIEIIVSLGDG